MPAVQEAAALKPETGRRPGGALRQPKDDPAQRIVRVSAGQSLFDISRTYSVNLRALIESNRLSPPYALEPGTTVTLPPPHIHQVERGETLFTVSERFNIDTRSLAVMNGLERPWRVWPGDELRLPPMIRDTWIDPPARGRNVSASAPRGAPAPSPASTSRKPAAKPAPRPPPRAAEPQPAPEVIDVASVGAFVWPVTGKTLKRFGVDGMGIRNEGINIAVPIGTPVRAAADGEVVYADDELWGLGNLVLIKHANGWVSAYAHLEATTVSLGERVRQGQTIARSGATGRVTEPQVHFQLRKGKAAVDPTVYLPAAQG